LTPGNRGLKKTNLLFLALVVCLNAGAWWLANRPLHPPPWEGKLRGACYAPYGMNANPAERQLLDPAGIDRDMALLAGIAGRVRLYSSRGVLGTVPAIAERHGLAVTAGAWLGRDLRGNDAEIDALIALTRKAGNVTSVLIGNEVLLRADIDAGRLIGYLRHVRSALTVPVSAAEPWHVWLANPQLVAEVDFIAVHILPYWEDIPLEGALPFFPSKKGAFRPASTGAHSLAGM